METAKLGENLSGVARRLNEELMCAGATARLVPTNVQSWSGARRWRQRRNVSDLRSHSWFYLCCILIFWLLLCVNVTSVHTSCTVLVFTFRNIRTFRVWCYLGKPTHSLYKILIEQLTKTDSCKCRLSLLLLLLLMKYCWGQFMLTAEHTSAGSGEAQRYCVRSNPVCF